MISANRTCVLSPDGIYRYRLTHRWGSGPALLFVMLNPSTADAEQDDPTIRRCLGFARREGFEALDVVNLFAYRATDPKDLVRCVDHPIGPDNDGHILQAAREAGLILAAWGAWLPRPWDVQPRRVVHAIEPRPIMSLGLTKSGQPKHPLYLSRAAPLTPYLLP